MLQILVDLGGFPPQQLQFGRGELRLNDSTRLAMRARVADFDIVLNVTVNVSNILRDYPGVVEEADDAPNHHSKCTHPGRANSIFPSATQVTRRR